MKLLRFFVLIFILFSASLFALNKEDFLNSNGDLEISNIKVIGLRKTRFEVIEKFIILNENTRLSNFNEEKLIQNLRALDLFNREITLNYSKENEAVIIDVQLEEKITFIPLPFYSYSSAGSSGGLFLMETNLLGYEKKLFTGGTFSEDEWSFTTGYIDPKILGSKYNMGAFVGFKESTIEDKDTNENTYRLYKSKNNKIKTFFGYGITETFDLKINLAYEEALVDDNYIKKILSPDGVQIFTYGGGVEYEKLYFNSVFNEGLFLDLVYRRSAVIIGDYDDYNTTEIGLSYASSPSQNALITFYSLGSFSEKPVPFQDRISGEGGFKTLPAGEVPADKYYSFSLSYEQAFLFLNWGTFTAYLAYESGAYDNDVLDWTEFYGPGAGLRMYLKKIALPALGIDYYFNQKTENFEASFSLGFSM